MSVSANDIQLCMINPNNGKRMSDVKNLNFFTGQDIKVTLHSTEPWNWTTSGLMKFNVFHKDFGHAHVNEDKKPIKLQGSFYQFSEDHLVFQFGFVPIKSGIYKIVAKFDDMPVSNSPMMIEVHSESCSPLLDMSSVFDEVSLDDNRNFVVSDQFQDAEDDQDHIKRKDKLLKLQKAYESIKSIEVNHDKTNLKNVKDTRKLDDLTEKETRKRIVPFISERHDFVQDITTSYSSRSSTELSISKPLNKMSQSSGLTSLISNMSPNSFTDVKEWRQVFSIPRSGHAGMGIPIGICLLPNGKFVVSSKRAGSAVKMYNQDDGKFLKELTCNRSDFDQPSDMATLKNGDFAIRDESKVMIFNSSGNFLRTVWESKGVLRSYGLAVDKNNQLVCMIEGRLSAYLQFCDPEDPKKRLQSIDLENVIGLNKRRSSCRFLTYKNDKFYVTDLGRDKVYVVNAENGDVKEFGESGDGHGQFNDPAGVVVDDQGNMIVADSKNHRLCVFNSKRKFLGELKLSPPVRRPSSLLFDSENGFLYVLCLHGALSVVKYAPIC